MLLLCVLGKCSQIHDASFIAILVVLDEKTQSQPTRHALFEFVFCDFPHQGVGTILQCTDGPSSNVDIVMLTQGDKFRNDTWELS